MKRYYLPSHEWVVESEDGLFLLGISEHAQEALGDIVFVSTVDVGEQLSLNDRFGDVESVKAVSELFSPVNGEVVEVNTELEDEPEKINQDPLNTWIVKVKGNWDVSTLLDEESYLALDKD